MIVKSTFDNVIECYTALKSKKKVKDASLAATLLVCEENRENDLFEGGIHYQGCFFWFASIPMLVECLNYHANQLNLPERLSASQLKAFLAIFKDKGEKSVCAEYRRLYAIKHSFRDQVNKKSGQLIMSAEEWCDKWFRGQQRGVGTSAMIVMRNKQLTRDEIDTWIRQVYNGGGGIKLRTLIEARDNPDFRLVNDWTKNRPCLWLEKLVPKDHPLSQNVNKWVRFISPNASSSIDRGYEYYPYRLVYLQYGMDGTVDYHAENQLTLPEGIRIQPDEVTIITEKEAKVQYENSRRDHPYNKLTWGNVTYTRLWNPKNVDFWSEFHSNLSEATWDDFSKCNEYLLVNGKRTYSNPIDEYNAPLTNGAEEMLVTQRN